MWKTVLAFVVGALSWIVCATVINWLLRAALAGYAAAEPAMHFTLTMMIARLLLGAAATLAGGFAMGWMVPGRRLAPLALGGLLLLVFIPGHAMLWDKFPLWYHLVFLSLLLPLTWLGAWAAPSLLKRHVAEPV